MIHNLITYTTLRTNHLKLDKNTITMAKSPPKSLNDKSNQRTSIHFYIKVKQPKNLQQHSSHKIEAAIVNVIMEKLEESYGNGHGSKTNNNYFAPLFESDDKEFTKHRNKPKTPIIVIRKEEEGRENKGDQNKGNEEYEAYSENRTTEKMYNPDSENELNGYFGMVEHDDNSDKDKEDNISRAKVRPIKNTKNKNYPS